MVWGFYYIFGLLIFCLGGEIFFVVGFVCLLCFSLGFLLLLLFLLFAWSFLVGWFLLWFGFLCGFFWWVCYVLGFLFALKSHMHSSGWIEICFVSMCSFSYPEIMSQSHFTRCSSQVFLSRFSYTWVCLYKYRSRVFLFQKRYI